MGRIRSGGLAGACLFAWDRWWLLCYIGSFSIYNNVWCFWGGVSIICLRYVPTYGWNLAPDLEWLEHLKHRFCSDLDQKQAFFWSKSELETPETLETLETPETPETPETLETLETLETPGFLEVL